jgi:hypothetical protein
MPPQSDRSVANPTALVPGDLLPGLDLPKRAFKKLLKSKEGLNQPFFVKCASRLRCHSATAIRLRKPVTTITPTRTPFIRGISRSSIVDQVAFSNPIDQVAFSNPPLSLFFRVPLNFSAALKNSKKPFSLEPI